MLDSNGGELREAAQQTDQAMNLASQAQQAVSYAREQEKYGAEVLNRANAEQA